MTTILSWPQCVNGEAWNPVETPEVGKLYGFLLRLHQGSKLDAADQAVFGFYEVQSYAD